MMAEPDAADVWNGAGQVSRSSELLARQMPKQVSPHPFEELLRVHQNSAAWTESNPYTMIFSWRRSAHDRTLDA
jgi:hypothetical protein